MSLIAFFDLEVNPEKKKILDIGSVRSDEAFFHKNDVRNFAEFIKDAEFLCGHNILAHDLVYLQQAYADPKFGLYKAIDTLLLSPLLFPKNPYHHLLKDDKLQRDELNNPLNDAKKARDLLYDEVNAFHSLPGELKTIFYDLLHRKAGYYGFLRFVHYSRPEDGPPVEELIQTYFRNTICDHTSLQELIQEKPVALAYALALLNAKDRYSITPPWVLMKHPQVENILFLLRNSPCLTGCPYCDQALNPATALNRYFGFTGFRQYGGEPLQENAVNATIQNKSILVVFPRGGGKSITFQLPALMSGDNAKALTVVISPLQSLMKDQVDNLEKKDIVNAVTINGLLDPIERGKAIERLESGQASLLYISPESLRSNTIRRLLLKRKIARFVVDEAHCFSSWGQDFRVDYLYIGDFIKNLQNEKQMDQPIPVSCFTATAKQKVIEDIQKYFKEKLNLDLEIFKASSTRANLHYQVFPKNDDEEKYNQLRAIIEEKNCPSIVYVSRTRRAYKLAERLSQDGFEAKPYHGKMDKEEKTANQNAFMTGKVDIMVATSAFGMGVDKSNVGAVVHYDISDSLENYVQEAGRAGRDESISAECYVLFNEEDLDKHFILLNQTRMSIKEINQVWRAIKDLTRTRLKVSNSALEIARKAGWDDGINEIETRITTAIAALEDAGYLKRGQNMPRIFANSILCKTAQEAISRINQSERFDEKEKVKAIRVIKKLFSSKSKRLGTDEDAESRVDYMADQLGLVKSEVIRVIELMREEKILADTKDLTAFIRRTENSNRSLNTVESFRNIELALLDMLNDAESAQHLKEMNEAFLEKGLADCTLNKLRTILNFWSVKNWVKKRNSEYSKYHINIALVLDKPEFQQKLEKRHYLARLITEYLYEKSTQVKNADPSQEIVLIEFSVQELKEVALAKLGLFNFSITIDDIEDTLFYLSRIEAIKIEGGFMVVHNSLSIERLEKNTRVQYKESDYEKLALYYQQKVQQVHIVGEYARKMIRNYNEALQFVEDYFLLNYSSFLNKYFPGSRQEEIQRPLTPEKFKQLFGALSPAQLEIIKDAQNQYIVVAAGPGSGKTRVLVHKLASLLLTEEVKHEQLLMLTFSRAAATDFKSKLLDLIGNAANFIDIKTFHSFCFDLLGRVGNLSGADTILQRAMEKIRNGDIERSGITRAVLVVDEAQDMSADEYALVKLLSQQNETLRVILVGDDDQNIYGFRGSDAKYMQQFIQQNNAKKYELVENYRSKKNIVDFSNQWIQNLPQRLKTFPGYAVQQDNGHINIIQYKDANLLVPLCQSLEGIQLTGSTCILTRTNDEAVQLNGLLVQKGLNAKLIQTNEGFAVSNLCEIRYFSDQLNSNADSSIFSEEEWSDAIRSLSENFSRSSKLNLALTAVKQFAQTNPVKKYKTDWKTFILESKMEDFANIDSETIFVSTIHKAKGKEFNNVILLLNGFMPHSDEEIRQLYVAVTRAKTNLSIHYNGTYLVKISTENLTYNHDNNIHPEVQQVTLLLNHKDVWLGYFKSVQRGVNALHSGDDLKILEEGLGNNTGQHVVRYSQKFKEILEGWKKKGFSIKKARVNFIVYWKDEEKGVEVKLLLPELYLGK
ncbi:MAG: RecQ family ATP-dependent DNA helicase [Ferruginibacter sp.]|nr:RecQ family ATP-dependent DNA helicase [Ferruginibacter sp.]